MLPPDQQYDYGQYVQVRENVTVLRIKRAIRPEMRGAVQNCAHIDSGLRLNFAIRIDDRADSSICRARDVTPIFDGTNNAHPEVLIRSRRLTKPSIIRDDNDEFRATFCKLPDQVRENAFVANDRRHFMPVDRTQSKIRTGNELADLSG